MTKSKKKWLKKTLIVFVIILGSFVTFGIYKSYQTKQQMELMVDLSFDESIQYTLQNHNEAEITIGIIQNGNASVQFYSSSKNEMENVTRLYEIGSLTKTFTASLINKSILERQLNLDDSINDILNVDNIGSYPTIEQLLTHTAGYKAYYFEPVMITNYFSNKNDFYGITKEDVIGKVNDNPIQSDKKSFNYSNFGYSVLGLVLEEIYQQNYVELMNDYLLNELELKNTKISNRQLDVENAWVWHEKDAYIPAGAIISNIEDMLAYAQMQLDGTHGFNKMHNALEQISIDSVDYERLGIRMDAVGMSWMIDSEHNINWHNGGTQSYNSYIGFNVDTQTAVVVLSNLPPDKGVSATILGMKLFESLN